MKRDGTRGQRFLCIVKGGVSLLMDSMWCKETEELGILSEFLVSAKYRIGLLH